MHKALALLACAQAARGSDKGAQTAGHAPGARGPIYLAGRGACARGTSGAGSWAPVCRRPMRRERDWLRFAGAI